MFCSECIVGHMQHGQVRETPIFIQFNELNEQQGGRNTCPLCRTMLGPENIMEIDVSGTEPETEEKATASVADTPASMGDVLSECEGDFGTKISAFITDVKRRLRAGPTTFKAVVFSAWNQLLFLLQKLDHNRLIA